MKQIIGIVLFLGSFLVYPLLGYIALNSNFSIGEKATYTTIAYTISWTSFFVGPCLAGPDLLARTNMYFGSKKSGND